MRFDIPGPHPRKAVLYRDFRERVYDLPCTVTDPADIEALSSVPGIQVVPDPPARVRPEPPADEEPKPKTSRKEV